MRKTILAALTGAALALTAGCTGQAAPAPQPAAAADPAESPAEEPRAEKEHTEKKSPPKIGDKASHDSSSDEELYEQAAEDFTTAWEGFTLVYNLGIVLGDDLVETDPDGSLDGFSAQRDALYELDGALRKIEWPDEMVEDVNAHLTSISDLIAVLDEIDRVEYVEDLEALYTGELQQARAAHQDTLDVVLTRLGLEMKESSEEEAPAEGGGAATEWGDGGEIIEDAGAVSDQLREAIQLGTPPGSSMGFPSEWVPFTHNWKFVGTAYPPDEYTIVGNSLVASKPTGNQIMGVVIKDALGGCEALVVDYGPGGKASEHIVGKRITGECTWWNAMETLGY